MTSAAIKSSAIASSYWGILNGVDLSIENSTIDLIPQHLVAVQENFSQKLDAIFIDIDTLHRGPLFFKSKSVDWKADALDFLDKKQTKIDRLLGINDKSSSRKTRELSQLIKVDQILSSILDSTSENDTIILFSDNGSDTQKKL